LPSTDIGITSNGSWAEQSIKSEKRPRKNPTQKNNSFYVSHQLAGPGTGPFAVLVVIIAAGT
jgi:hypothetical protein